MNTEERKARANQLHEHLDSVKETVVAGTAAEYADKLRGMYLTDMLAALEMLTESESEREMNARWESMLVMAPDEIEAHNVRLVYEKQALLARVEELTEALQMIGQCATVRLKEISAYSQQTVTPYEEMKPETKEIFLNLETACGALTSVQRWAAEVLANSPTMTATTTQETETLRMEYSTDGGKTWQKWQDDATLAGGSDYLFRRQEGQEQKGESG